MRYFPTIGLEIHAELLTKSKIFCSCSAEFGGEPNSRCCPVCSGLPGTLPVLNRRAVEYIVKAGYATDCEISRFTKWDRKNYFYPDLPKAYQISQMPRPVCQNGYVDISVKGESKRIRINRIHLEEDAGKLIHDDTQGISLADYNRCGIPLIEIVTEPDLHSAEEVTEFFEQIKLRLQYAGVCDCKMEQGSIRCDINISIAPEGSDELGTRTELKNLNSMRAAAKAIAAEIARQKDILESGGKVVQETRRYDDTTGETVALRSKEEAHDYRYFPDPDIPPIIFSEEELDEIQRSLPEMPHKLMDRYLGTLGISPNDAVIIVSDKRISDFFELAVSSDLCEPKNLAAYLVGEFMRRVNLGEIELADIHFAPAEFARLAGYLYTEKLSQANAKLILDELAANGGTVNDIADKGGMWITNDTAAVSELLDKLFSENPKAVEQYRNGDKKVLGFFMGRANKALKGAASPKVIQQLIAEKLGE